MFYAQSIYVTFKLLHNNTDCYIIFYITSTHLCNFLLELERSELLVFLKKFQSTYSTV